MGNSFQVETLGLIERERLLAEYERKIHLHLKQQHLQTIHTEINSIIHNAITQSTQSELEEKTDQSPLKEEPKGEVEQTNELLLDPKPNEEPFVEPNQVVYSPPETTIQSQESIPEIAQEIAQNIIQENKQETIISSEEITTNIVTIKELPSEPELSTKYTIITSEQELEDLIPVPSPSSSSTIPISEPSILAETTVKQTETTPRTDDDSSLSQVDLTQVDVTQETSPSTSSNTENLSTSTQSDSSTLTTPTPTTSVTSTTTPTIATTASTYTPPDITQETPIIPIELKTISDEKLQELIQELYEDIDYGIRTHSQFDSRIPTQFQCPLQYLENNKDIKLSLSVIRGIQGYQTVSIADLVMQFPTTKFLLQEDQMTMSVNTLTPYQQSKTNRVKGHFKCGRCHKGWTSSKSWMNKSQECSKCHAKCYSFYQQSM